MKYLGNEWGEVIPLSQIQVFKIGRNFVYATTYGIEFRIVGYPEEQRRKLNSKILSRIIGKIEAAFDREIITFTAGEFNSPDIWEA